MYDNIRPFCRGYGSVFFAVCLLYSTESKEMNKKTSIGLLCNTHAWGGLEINVLHLARWFAQEGHAVWVFAPEDSRALRTATDMAGVTAVSFESGFKHGNVFAAMRLGRILRWNDIQNLFTSHSNDIHLMVLAKLRLNGTLRTFYYQQMNLGVDKNDALHTFFYRRLDHWITPLPSMAEVVRKRTCIGEEQLRIVPLCIETEKFVSVREKRAEARHFFQLPAAPLMVGTIGRIDPQKGQAYLIKALHTLRKKGYDWHALFIGDETNAQEGEYMAYLKALITEYQLEKVVHFRAFTERTDLAFASLDVFAMTSHSETFGMVTVEAMTAALPIVGSREGGTPHLLAEGETGVLFESKNADDLAQKLEPLFADANERKRMGNAAQKKALQSYAHTAQIQALTALLHV